MAATQTGLTDFRLPGAHPPDPRPLPMTRAEMSARGWDACDVILITGDAYVDHPSFGVALIGRVLEWLGYRVGIIAQPDPANAASFSVLGAPRLFWGVTAGNLDSQLARLTVMRKIRHDDPYAAGGMAGRRPPNATIAYTARARQVAKGVPVVIGGIEASLRRFAFYDYWTDAVRRSVLVDAKADLLAFGMAERSIAEIAWRLHHKEPARGIRGTAEIRREAPVHDSVVEMPSYEDVAAPTPAGRVAFGRMAKLIHERGGADDDAQLVQRHGDRVVIVQSAALPLESEELDLVYGLPFSRRPHTSYGGARIPAFDMIVNSITTHRGCYAGCSFCAITAHQGAAVRSRSRPGISDEVRRLVATSDFHGTISDLGGPTANMYGTGCRLGRLRCRHRSCLFPDICSNLETSHKESLALLREVRRLPGVNHVYITSGVRYDLALTPGAGNYAEELVAHHVCGRLKIAPEHTVSRVLQAMRKPAPEQYRNFVDRFRAAARRTTGSTPELVEYFISGHPGCSLEDMITMALELRQAGVRPEQVQDFYPAPMTLAAAMYYTSVDPLTGQAVHVARTDREKALQRAVLLCHLPEFHRKAREALRAAGRDDLIGRGAKFLVPPGI